MSNSAFEKIPQILMRYRGQRDEFDSMESKEWQDDRPLRTIFYEILFSSRPENEKTIEHLTEEAVAIITAAEENTAAILQTAIYHMFSAPSIHERLRNELKKAMPDACTLKEWRERQALPYLVSLSLSAFQCKF